MAGAAFLQGQRLHRLIRSRLCRSAAEIRRAIRLVRRVAVPSVALVELRLCR